MEWHQTLTIIASVLTPMLAGFAWIISWLKAIDRSVNEIDKRVIAIETILAMMGAPVHLKNKERTDP
jgi:hypothetical protein